MTDERLMEAEEGDREGWEVESGRKQELASPPGRVGNLQIRLCVLAQSILQHA